VTAPRQRLDLLLVDRGLAESREKAQRLILAGQVRVDGHVQSKPGHTYARDAAVEVATPERYVSRGGEKLEAAFETFALRVEGVVCMDVGASTGGFTDCLLQHGAARVYAIDVGRGQLHPKIATDARVTVFDQVNARHLKVDELPEKPAFATIDVSFISLTKVLPAVLAALAPHAQLVTLIKPQFEAGREQIARGGVVNDPDVRQQVIDRVRDFGVNQLGLAWKGCCPSPLTGPAGNVEFLAWWEKHESHRGHSQLRKA
jgi:23S rRNA (cytidine1920-2'-O)/16S rRNA (cytidine1409-2'-O)-methyltransferase